MFHESRGFPGENLTKESKKMNQKEYLKQLTPKGFLHHFASVLIATYLNHKENDNKLPEDFNQELYEKNLDRND